MNWTLYLIILEIIDMEISENINLLIKILFIKTFIKK